MKKNERNAKYFRNKKQINHVDPESLWKLDKKTGWMELVDEDQCVLVEFNSPDWDFYEVPCPEELKKK